MVDSQLPFVDPERVSCPLRFESSADASILWLLSAVVEGSDISNESITDNRVAQVPRCESLKRLKVTFSNLESIEAAKKPESSAVRPPDLPIIWAVLRTWWACSLSS